MRTLKKTLALVLVLAMVFSLAVTASADFTDAEEIKYAEEVELLTALGVIEGYPDGSFGPTKTLNRAEAAVMIARLNAFTDTTAATPTYTDMAGYNWSNWAVAYAENAGIVNGTAAGIYEPATTLTGYMWVKMLLVSLGYDAEEYGMTGAAWQIGVAKLDKTVGISGGELDLSKAITREEAAMCAYNALFVTRDGATYAVEHWTMDEDYHIHYFYNEIDAIAFCVANGLDTDTDIETGKSITSLGFEKFGLQPMDMYFNAWGQPFYAYKVFGGEYVCITEIPAAVTFTKATDDDSFFKACVAAGIEYSEDSSTEDYIDVEGVTINGCQDGGCTAYKGWNDYNIDFTGNGTMTYVYDTVYGVYVASIEQFIGKVVAEVAAVESTGADAYVVIKNLCDDYVADANDDSECGETYTLYNSDLKLGDIVLFNVNYTYRNYICNIKTPSVVSGTITEIDLKNTEQENDDVYVIGSKEYNVSRHDNLVAAGGDTANWYVDDCGNLMMKASDIAFEYKIGFLLSYDAQNRWDGDKNHTCESYEASETFEIYDIATGKTITLQGAVTATAAKTTFVTGAVVTNSNASVADKYDLDGTVYNQKNDAGLSLGLVVYLTNEDGEIIYISDKESGNGALKIRTTTKDIVVDTDVALLTINNGKNTEPDWFMNDATEYVYATLETAHEITAVATGLKNAETISAVGEFVFDTTTNKVVAVAQYLPEEEEEPEEPVVEDVIVYVSGDFSKEKREFYEIDKLGNKVGPKTEWVVTGLYIDGVAQDAFTFDADPFFLEVGNFYAVEIVDDVWNVYKKIEPGFAGVITYIGTGAAGDYFLMNNDVTNTCNMAEDAHIVCINDTDKVLGTNESITELMDKYETYKIVVVFGDTDGDGLVSDLYYMILPIDLD